MAILSTICISKHILLNLTKIVFVLPRTPISSCFHCNLSYTQDIMFAQHCSAIFTRNTKNSFVERTFVFSSKNLSVRNFQLTLKDFQRT